MLVGGNKLEKAHAKPRPANQWGLSQVDRGLRIVVRFHNNRDECQLQGGRPHRHAAGTQHTKPVWCRFSDHQQGKGKCEKLTKQPAQLPF